MEVEIKLLLEPDEASRLSDTLDAPVEVLDQENHFFDDAERSLSRAGWAVRLRRETGEGIDRGWCTVKGSGRAVAGFVQRPEFERDLATDVIRHLRLAPAELLKVVRDLAPPDLPEPGLSFGEIGAFENRRERYRMPGAEELMLELDRSSWPDGSVSHELEVELADPGRAEEVEGRLRAFLEDTGVAWRPGKLSKFARLLSMLG